LSLGMSLGVFVVLDVASLGSIDSMISSHRAVLARKPVRASLAEYDVAGDHILLFKSFGQFSNHWHVFYLTYLQTSLLLGAFRARLSPC
jgi:hypothetical protein